MVKSVLDELKQKANYRTLKEYKKDGDYLIINNERKLNLSSNDYLNLSSLQKDFFKNNEYFNLSSDASRLLCGGDYVHKDFEDYLSLIYKKQALLFNSGYCLNLSCISALSKLKNSLFLCDKNIHASMIDGLMLNNANFKRYKHSNLDELKELLLLNANKYDYIFILSEAVFSMDGDILDVDKLIQLKKEFKNVYLYIDEAHSIGVLGQNGYGLSYLNDIDFCVLTFGKALASNGAVMLCADIFKEYFINTARSLIYSTSISPIIVAWTFYLFKQLKNFDNLRQNLKELSLLIDEELKSKFKIDGTLHIKMLRLNSNEEADFYAKKLFLNSYYLPAIKKPTTLIPSLRFSLKANFTKEEILKFCKVIKSI